MHRRTFLRTIGVAPLATVAGCGDGGNSDGPSPTPTTQPSETETPTATETQPATEPPSPTPPSPDVAQVVDVGGDGLRFTPGSFEIVAGDSVLWEWNGSGHNVVPDSIPDGAAWSGSDGGAGTTYDAGHEHLHAFEVAGEYTYYCAPHRSAGMTGFFTVVE